MERVYSTPSFEIPYPFFIFSVGCRLLYFITPCVPVSRCTSTQRLTLRLSFLPQNLVEYQSFGSYERSILSDTHVPESLSLFPLTVQMSHPPLVSLPTLRYLKSDKNPLLSSKNPFPDQDEITLLPPFPLIRDLYFFSPSV